MPIALTGALWPPDWSQFIPDAILTVITGLGLGLLLYLIQRTAETRAVRRFARNSWRLSRTTVGAAVAIPINHEENGVDLLVFVNYYFSPVLEAGQKLDVAEWSDALSDDKELKALAALLEDIPRLRRLAGELRSECHQAVHRAGTMPGYASRFYEFAQLMILGVPDPARVLLVANDQWSEIAARALEDPRMVELIPEFQGLLTRVEANYETLRASLT